MKICELGIKGVLLIEIFKQVDERGSFIKPFTKSHDIIKLINFEIREIFYSISKKNVIRGMHFQRPPKDCSKLIYLTRGSVIDVLLDMRKSSPTYLEFLNIKLLSNENALFIPSGIAHGYLSLENATTVVYNQSNEYSKKHDDGILWNSFGYDWGIENPILSERDKIFNHINNYDSPFE
jgi:dTDP-4-dehydrorhamnose 3,5-epimerase